MNITNTGCYKCSAGCCCICQNYYDCYLCSPDKGRECGMFTSGWNQITTSDKYPTNYICWKCKRTWKASLYDRRSQESIKHDKEIYNRYSCCPQRR